jgi:4-hydroxy-tetrahydrodipicolinate reductase
MVRVAVAGATGRMGRELLAAAAERDLEVVLAVARSEGAVAGHDVVPDDDLAARLREREVQVLVDFSAPAASREYAAACADAGVAYVVGTTGFDAAGEDALDAAADAVPVLDAPNFARGVQALCGLAGDAAGALPDYDVELVETHHAQKRDAPSGTANRIVDAVDDARGEPAERVHGREGDAPRNEGEVGVHAVRAGSVTGRHELVLAGASEELRLVHRVEDRRVFAEGALDAADWLAGRDAGRYDFAEVLG